MNVQVLSAWEDLATRKREWQALAEASRALPEWTPPWCIPWWRELGKGRLRAVAAEEDDGSLVGLGLFCESRAPGPQAADRPRAGQRPGGRAAARGRGGRRSPSTSCRRPSAAARRAW